MSNSHDFKPAIHWVSQLTSRATQDTRGVSELIGYITLFGIILSTVVFASVSGAPIVNEQSAERAIDATEEVLSQVDHDVQKVQTNTDGQVSQIQVPAGQLRQTQSTEIQIQQPGSGKDVTLEITPLEYSSKEQPELLYTGAFISHSRSGNFVDDASIQMRHASHANTRTPVFVLPELGTEQEISAYSTSQRAATVQFDITQANVNTSATTEIFSSADGSIDVTINSPAHAAAWEAYFEEHPAIDSISRTPGDTSFSFTITFGPDGVTGESVTVTSQEVIISFTRR